jgi:glyoxylase-like metal-dependent hydrolase (beta-lactamase superfamily II)
MRRAVKEVTDEPVTHFVYSHWHKDHTGSASIWGPNVKYIGHERTREKLVRWPDDNSPVPTETFTKDTTLDVNSVKLDLSYKGQNHCEGNIFIYAPQQKVLAAIDIISPGWSTFRHCDASENFRGWVEAHDQILEYDFTAIVAGHVNRWGTREDAIASREYIHDIVAFAQEALEQAAYRELIERIGYSNVWVLWENYLNDLTNYVTKKTLEKKSSNGQTWARRLAGADVMTKYHAYSIVEAMRLEWASSEGWSPNCSSPRDGRKANDNPIIGLGRIGSPLAQEIVAGGQAVVLAARDQSKATALANRLGPLASIASIQEAITRADVVIVAVPFDVIKEIAVRFRRSSEGQDRRRPLESGCAG